KQPMRLISRILLASMIVALLAFTYWAAQGAPDVMWTSAPGWSWARRVALSAADTPAPQVAPLAVDGAGQIYLLTIARRDAAPQALLTAYGRDAGVRWRRELSAPAGEIHQPALLWDGQMLRALWLDHGRIYGSTVGPSGEVLAAAQPLGGSAQVESFAAASDGRGATFIWYAGAPEAPGIFAQPPGDLTGPPTQIAPAGSRPAIQLTTGGALVATWVAPEADKLAIWRGVYPGGDPTRGRAEAVGSIEMGPGLALSGPWLSADDADGYLLWNLTVTQGRTAGSSYAQYLSFPLDGGPASEVRAIGLPTGADLDYVDGAGGPQVALGAGGVAGGGPPADCAAPVGPGAPAMICKAQVRHRASHRFSQAGAILLAGGQPAGYQLISFGDRSAYAPALARDGAGQLYASWLSMGAGGFDVYLASTAPDMRAALGQMGLRDVGRVGFEIIYGMISGALFSPLTALLWSLAPLAIIGLTAGLRRDHGDLRHWATLLSLGLALAAYWFAKWTLLADARSYVPFAAWVPGMPGWLGLPLRLGVPMIIGGLSLWAAWRLTYRRGANSAALFLLAYVAVDAPLTMAIYGGVFFGAFYPFA
ncbi:hypothetical protein K2Z83_05255, partial [Oscillochloris sp. ZM17-4]